MVAEDTVAEIITETDEFQTLIEALSLIDHGLSTMLNRELVASSEVADLLLDVRMLLAPLTTADLGEPEIAVAAN
jgi:hypothetical protein